MAWGILEDFLCVAFPRSIVLLVGLVSVIARGNLESKGGEFGPFWVAVRASGSVGDEAIGSDVNSLTTGCGNLEHVSSSCRKTMPKTRGTFKEEKNERG